MVLHKLNETEKLNKTNKDIGAKVIPRRLFGNDLILKDPKNSTGLSYGSQRVTASGNYANCLDIANLNSKKLRTIGSNNYLMNIQNAYSINT